MLLTRLPVGRVGGPADLARCVWAFPVVGLVVNGTGALVFWLLSMARVPPLLAAIWTLAATLALTGALHEDGLADTADGFGGGDNAARKLEIMRDSRIGTFGAAALVVSLMVRGAAVAALGSVLPALIVAGVLGRSAMIVPLLMLSPARGDGLGAAVGRPRALRAAAGLGVGVVASYALLPVLPATASVAAAVGSALIVTGLAARQIGGYTGDVLGATEVVTECVVLTVLAGASGG